MITFFDVAGNYDVQDWLAKLSKVPGQNDSFLLICHSGNRTGTVSKFLDAKLGYTKVHNVRAGITG